MKCKSVRSLHTALCAASDNYSITSRSGISYKIHRTLDGIDKMQWEKLGAGQSIFLSFDYLKALSAANADASFRFVTFHAKEKFVGLAAMQVSGFTSGNLSANLDVKNPLVKFLARKLTPPAASANSVLVIGNAFATGEHAFIFDSSVSPQAGMDALCFALTDVLKKEEKAGRRISVVLVKDFYNASSAWPEALKRCGFATFHVDRNMVMPILPEWKNFDDYLAALNSKFRTKAHSVLKKSATLEVRDLSADDIVVQTEMMAALFSQVLARADFKMGSLDMATLASLKKQLCDKMIVRGFYLEKKLAGFLVAFVYSGVFDAHIVGFDYPLNRAHAIYPAMLYNHVRTAIEMGMSEIHFGRTAGEIKTSVGALPVDLTCCIKHTGKISNFMLKLLFSYVRPSDFPQRQPYRKTVFRHVEASVGDS